MHILSLMQQRTITVLRPGIHVYEVLVGRGDILEDVDGCGSQSGVWEVIEINTSVIFIQN